MRPGRFRLLVPLFVLASSVGAAPLEELLPRPKRCTPSGGNVGYAGFPVETVMTNAVAAVPAHLRKESYRLEIRPDGVRISAPDERGVRHARTTLEQLSRLSDGQLPCCTIEDWPSHAWRGLMHDCGRNFLDLGSIRKVLDLMARYKMNLFHWHLTDYYGWRLESKRYPMLQAAWAFRRQMNRYYTQEDFKAIVAYAKARGITVLPELDVPGHTLAFRRGLGIGHMSEGRVKQIVSDLIDELCSLVPAEDMPYVHLGTDEARTPWEMVPDSYCPAWAERVCANGRKPVGWTPGKSLETTGGVKPVKMIWHGALKIGPDESAFDASRYYFGRYDPFLFLNSAVFSQPCRWDVPDENRLGVVICSWHDDFLGEDTSRALLNNNIAAAIVSLSDLEWNRREKDRPEFLAKLPKPGTADFDEAVRFEAAIAAQRDKALDGLDMPFAWVRQTDLRWRITDGEGRLVAKDVAQGTVYLHKPTHWSGTPELNSYLPVSTGVATVETWIRSPKAQTVGAWIGFTGCVRSGGRSRGLPEAGEWGSSKGSTVEVNGVKIPPPAWSHPGLKYVMEHPEEPTSNNVSETPWADEEYWMRPPAAIALREGWNHVRLTAAKTYDAHDYAWVATFVPIAGTSANPREVEGLEYSSEPK